MAIANAGSGGGHTPLRCLMTTAPVLITAARRSPWFQMAPDENYVHHGLRMSASEVSSLG